MDRTCGTCLLWCKRRRPYWPRAMWGSCPTGPRWKERWVWRGEAGCGAWKRR